ncbi:hypothetical protein F5Y13DRAFT_204534 [Hypoxylon sp. FL1857]|nr:hypothetical protein F5Y13DRAFT_204534 [Hypoxylon sp. FL1857]
MCFIEYLGYTCGHTSIPVKRPCPLTTQLYNNPCCPNAAARPLLAQTMCPGCARVLHGRYVNIIEHEHRFMHERGACNCEVKFPYLQQPRVIQHEEPELVPTTICECCLEGMAKGAKKEDVEKSIKAETDMVDSSPSGSGSATEFTPDSAQSPTDKFNFSPSALVFTPGHAQSQDQGHSQNTDLVLYESTTTSSITARANLGKASAGSSSKSRVVSRNTDASFGTPSRASSSFDKGKGKGKQRNTKKRSPSPRQQHHEAYQQQRSRRTSSSAAAQGAPKLAPLFEERESSGKKLEVSVRMPSLYGAEWIQDHAELHRAGRCRCEIKFEKYPAQYMPLLKEARDAEFAFDDHSSTTTHNHNHSHSAAGVVSSNSQLYYSNDDTAATSGVEPGTSSTPHTNTSPTRYETPATPGRMLAIEQAPPAPGSPRIPAPEYPGPFYASGQPGSASSPSSPTFSTQPGHPARWACSPYDTTPVDASRAAQAAASRPVDMQTIWYDQRETPIAGLPVGAGPEGDSHMPPFEECELYYRPKAAAGGRRPASR